MRGATSVRWGVRSYNYFDPRSSCEERRVKQDQYSINIRFRSTLLMRGATIENLIKSTGLFISIHAPHARSDISDSSFFSQLFISIHAPHARSDCQIPRPYRQRDSDQFSANPKKINIITAFMHIYIMFGTGSR